MNSQRGQAVLISLQADPDAPCVGGKRALGAFEAQKAIARGDGKNGAARSALFLSCAGLASIGALAQLGEHLLCKQRVIGSIPIGSTMFCGGSAAETLLWSVSGKNMPSTSVRGREGCVTSGLRPRHMPRNDPQDRFVRRSRNGMWVGSSGG